MVMVEASLQERWRLPPGAQGVELVEAVSSLPIFEVASDGTGFPKPDPTDPAGFTDLKASALHLVPDAAPRKGTCTKACVIPSSDSEWGVLVKHYRLRCWSLAEFYRQV